MTVLALITGGAALAGGLMLLLWLVSLRTGNAGIVDAGWAGGIALLAIYYALLADGAMERRVAVAAMAGFWGLRLAAYLLKTRVIGHPEEGRYVELRRQWKTNLPLKFLLFFEFQGALCVVLSLPFLLSARNAANHSSGLEFAGVALFVIAVAGESFADAQLARFKSNPANKGLTCRAGMWQYSRHPNYFCEWLIWVAFALFASASPYGLWSWICPALILYFVLCVTGIPPTEAQALRSRGDEYRRYQETTSAFFPWFPKEPLA